MEHVLIFLDVDGVINTTSYRKWLKDNGHSIRNSDMEFDPDAMDNLQAIVDQFKAKLIISSSWRFGLANDIESTTDLSCMNLINRLAQAGMKIYDKTPVFGDRGQEILKYIETYAKACNIDPENIAYIAIDDDAFGIEPYISPACFIHTNHIDGFNNSCALQAEYSLAKQIEFIEKNLALKAKPEVFGTKKESRDAYKKYVETHIENVKKAFNMFGIEFAERIQSQIGRENRGWLISTVKKNIIEHDKSKFGTLEFEAYAAKFYPCKEDLDRGAEAIEAEFQKAWEHHYKFNNHHPEHWKVNIDGKEIYAVMSSDAVLEMILDWISVSMTYKTSTYDWWFNNPSGRQEKTTMLCTDNIEVIDSIMNDFKDRLNFSKSKS